MTERYKPGLRISTSKFELMTAHVSQEKEAVQFMGQSDGLLLYCGGCIRFGWNKGQSSNT